MKINTVYIDDDETDLKKYTRKFKEHSKSKNLFKIIPRNSQEEKISDLIKDTKKDNPDLILLDFDLSEPLNDIVIGVSGAILATALKEGLQDVPIILFTRENVFNRDIYSPQVLSSIDDTIFKSDVFKKHINLLYSLAVGFKKLRDTKSKKWPNLIKALKAQKSDYDDLKLSNPPITSGRDWKVSEATDWILKILIKYPGILYDSVHSATLLGISEKEFLSDEIQRIFAKAKYSGIFSIEKDRWWRSKLREIAFLKMNKEERELYLRNGFPLVLKRIKKKKVKLSECIFSGKSPTETVCYILKKPVMFEFSLTYRVDSRPQVMDGARVSYKAIRTSNEINDDLFDPIGKEMLSDIQRRAK